MADARLSSNVALRSGCNALSGNQTVTSGSVGIGTNNPSAPLHVATSGIINAIMDSSSSLGTWMDLRNTGPGGTNWLLISTASGNGEGAGKFGLLGRLGARVERAGAVALERQRCHRQWHLQQQQRP